MWSLLSFCFCGNSHNPQQIYPFYSIYWVGGVEVMQRYFVQWICLIFQNLAIQAVYLSNELLVFWTEAWELVYVLWILCFVVAVCKYITFVMWCELMWIVNTILQVYVNQRVVYIIYEYKCITDIFNLIRGKNIYCDHKWFCWYRVNGKTEAVVGAANYVISCPKLLYCCTRVYGWNCTTKFSSFISISLTTP